MACKIPEVNEKFKVQSSKVKDNQKFVVEFKRRLYGFTLVLLKLIDTLPHNNVSRRLGDQLLRSGTSILANFVEGQSGSSKKDFINYMQISLKSSNETKMWLSLLKDSRKAKSNDVEPLLAEATEFSKILASIVLTAKGKR
ncbi:MAG: four helix bundle protein [Bacteroidota bacterium]|nr:four helix bundle protein [Bacteroidota bacterium]